MTRPPASRHEEASPIGFDQTATFCGAVGATDWTAGWTSYSNSSAPICSPRPELIYSSRVRAIAALGTGLLAVKLHQIGRAPPKEGTGRNSGISRPSTETSFPWTYRCAPADKVGGAASSGRSISIVCT